MCHDQADDSKESAGAPEAEIEVTPEMIEAGCHALSLFHRKDDPSDEFVKEVYVAMRRRDETFCPSR